MCGGYFKKMKLQSCFFYMELSEVMIKMLFLNELVLYGKCGIVRVKNGDLQGVIFCKHLIWLEF